MIARRATKFAQNSKLEVTFDREPTHARNHADFKYPMNLKCILCRADSAEGTVDWYIYIYQLYLIHIFNGAHNSIYTLPPCRIRIYNYHFPPLCPDKNNGPCQEISLITILITTHSFSKARVNGDRK